MINAVLIGVLQKDTKSHYGGPMKMLLAPEVLQLVPISSRENQNRFLQAINHVGKGSTLSSKQQGDRNQYGARGSHHNATEMKDVKIVKM